jgi:hypothetical protein
MGVVLMVLNPVPASTNIEVFIAMVFDKEVHQESSVLKAARVLLERSLEINAGKFPLFSVLTSFLSICDKK